MYIPALPGPRRVDKKADAMPDPELTISVDASEMRRVSYPISTHKEAFISLRAKASASRASSKIKLSSIDTVSVTSCSREVGETGTYQQARRYAHSPPPSNVQSAALVMTQAPQQQVTLRPPS